MLRSWRTLVVIALCVFAVGSVVVLSASAGGGLPSVPPIELVPNESDPRTEPSTTAPGSPTSVPPPASTIPPRPPLPPPAGDDGEDGDDDGDGDDGDDDDGDDDDGDDDDGGDDD